MSIEHDEAPFLRRNYPYRYKGLQRDYFNSPRWILKIVVTSQAFIVVGQSE